MIDRMALYGSSVVVVTFADAVVSLHYDDFDVFRTASFAVQR